MTLQPASYPLMTIIPDRSTSVIPANTETLYHSRFANNKMDSRSRGNHGLIAAYSQNHS
jgi:hypothetical protein